MNEAAITNYYLLLQLLQQAYIVMTVHVCLFARILLCPSQGQNACKERMMLVVLALMQPKTIRMSTGCPIPWPSGPWVPGVFAKAHCASMYFA